MLYLFNPFLGGIFISVPQEIQIGDAGMSPAVLKMETLGSNPKTEFDLET